MAGPGTPELNLQAENLRLAEQVRACLGTNIFAASRAWRDATPAERVAETWRLCALVPWFRIALARGRARARRRARAAAGEHPGDSRAVSSR